MKVSTISRPGMYFTHEHEWIDFNGTVGFVGISLFRLKEISEIDSIKWLAPKGTVVKGTLMAEIHANNTIIPIHAPVSCKFLGPNAKLKTNLNLILQSPQDQGWIFFVTPSKFQSRDNLLLPEAYQKNLCAKVS